MKKILLVLVTLFAVSIIPASAQGYSCNDARSCGDIRFVSKKPTKDVITGVSGTKYIYAIYKVRGGQSIGNAYVSLYDNGSIEVENDTKRKMKAGARGTRADGSRAELRPAVLDPDGASVQQTFKGGKFVKATLVVEKLW